MLVVHSVQGDRPGAPTQRLSTSLPQTCISWAWASGMNWQQPPGMAWQNWQQAPGQQQQIPGLQLQPWQQRLCYVCGRTPCTHVLCRTCYRGALAAAEAEAAALEAAQAAPAAPAAQPEAAWRHQFYKGLMGCFDISLCGMGSLLQGRLTPQHQPN